MSHFTVIQLHHFSILVILKFETKWSQELTVQNIINFKKLYFNLNANFKISFNKNFP
jgi:hypothetical protein